jgi:Protein of unknown function (DUF2510)
MSDSTASVPPGWYDDGTGQRRWWDGTQWTDHFELPTAVAVPEATPVALPNAAVIRSTQSDLVTAYPQRRFSMTAAERFWYVLQCIAFGAGYFAKIPTKRALADLGLARMTGAEKFWYVLQCIAFGAGYFAKVPVKRALEDLTNV